MVGAGPLAAGAADVAPGAALVPDGAADVAAVVGAAVVGAVTALVGFVLGAVVGAAAGAAPPHPTATMTARTITIPKDIYLFIFSSFVVTNLDTIDTINSYARMGNHHPLSKGTETEL